MSSPCEGLKGVHEGGSSGCAAPACGACGARARRASARFCSTCGRAHGGGYFPADSLRASYRFERPRVTRTNAAASNERGRRARRAGRQTSFRGESFGGDVMFGGDRNGAAASALAFAAYALVPYLGILFCPGAVLCGGVGLLRAWRSPQRGGRRESALGLALGLLIFCAQLLLWWVLYKVPEWSRQQYF